MLKTNGTTIINWSQDGIDEKNKTDKVSLTVLQVCKVINIVRLVTVRVITSFIRYDIVAFSVHIVC